MFWCTFHFWCGFGTCVTFISYAKYFYVLQANSFHLSHWAILEGLSSQNCASLLRIYRYCHKYSLGNVFFDLLLCPDLCQNVNGFFLGHCPILPPRFVEICSGGNDSLKLG